MVSIHTAINMTNDTSEATLDEIDYQQFLRKDIPSVIFLILVMIVGIIGNIHTLLVYSISPEMKKLAIRVFILWLSATDLIACLFCIPFEIADIRLSYTFSSAGACKFFRFLNHSVTLSSAGLLTAIAVERYNINRKRTSRPVMRPILWSNVASGCIVVLGSALSTPAFVFYGLKEKETDTDLIGRDCTILSQYQNIRTAALYSGIVILLSTICCVVCVVIYGKILYIICTQMKKEQTRLDKSDQNKRISAGDITSKETKEVSLSMAAVDSNSKNVMPQKDVSNKDKKKPKRSKFEKGRQLTISLIVATGISYLGYLIYVSTILVRIANPKLYKNSIRPATAILLRAYFINNAANPVVFCFLDARFRKECKQLYRNIVCCQRD